MKPNQTSPASGHDFSVTKLRFYLTLFIGSAIFFPDIYQSSLTRLWIYLSQNALYRSSTFETFWTVFCYAAIEPWMTVIFLRHPEWRLLNQRVHSQNRDFSTRLRKPHGMRRPSRRLLEALVYIVPLLALDLTMIKKFADVSLSAMLESGNYDIDTVRVGCRGNTCEKYFLMPSLHNFTLASPLQVTRALPVHAPSSRRLVLELGVSLVVYDAVFFVFHLVLHTLPGLRAWHGLHHNHLEIHPQITNRLHVVERLGLVLLANFALNVIRSHVLTRTLFVPLFVWLLVEIHCGLDLPWGYDRILPQGWGGGARKHARHHADGSGGLEPFFSWCDWSWDWIRGMGRGRKGRLG